MPSTFFGLTVAGSGVNAYQAAINTTANNVANLQTEGYSKQVANITYGEALRVYAKYGSVGTGVQVTSIKQLRDGYYDTKYWENQKNVGYYNEKLYFMSQIEGVFVDDDVTTGFTTLMADMNNALNELKADSASVTERRSFIAEAETKPLWPSSSQ